MLSQSRKRLMWVLGKLRHRSKLDGHVPPRETREEFIMWHERQPQKCAICGDHEHLRVDHCHATGKLRGLLCNTCNVMVGYVEKRLGQLHMWTDYIQRHRHGTE